MTKSGLLSAAGASRGSLRRQQHCHAFSVCGSIRESSFEPNVLWAARAKKYRSGCLLRGSLQTGTHEYPLEAAASTTREAGTNAEHTFKVKAPGSRCSVRSRSNHITAVSQERHVLNGSSPIQHADDP